MPTFVLTLENDTREVSLIRKALGHDGFELIHCTAVQEAKALIRQFRFSLALVDPVLGGADNGLDFVRHAREVQPELGIMVISGCNTVSDRIVGYQVGADDYLPRPFDPAELAVRARRLAQRVRNGPTQPEGVLYRFSGFTLDRSRRILSWGGGAPIRLTGREFELLLCLVESSNRVVRREALASLICGRSWQTLDRSVDVMVSNLRRKLREANPGEMLIKSVRGVGYCFGSRVEAVA